ncbi:hypothetical protein EHS25_009313 [Saitozyma podzolica]|uniref:Uncharacterized protein n=1 Tax=Saitozyma podzolica TaxID=1890683 RepID=A0A427YLH8_9TREE|nr:hypothetical protein EHS25_009313 [Saitozyma podzolica]
MSENIELRPVGKSANGPPLPPRHPDSEPGTLGRAYRLAEDKAKAAVHLQEGGLDVVSTWGLGAAAWFVILAIPLLLFPRILLFFAQTKPSAFEITDLDREHYDSLTPLESFLCLTLSLGLIACSLITLFVLVPTYEPPATPAGRKPLLGILVGLTSLMSVVSINTASIGALGKVVGGGNVVIAIWGWWVIVFGNMRWKERKSKVPDRFKKL